MKKKHKTFCDLAKSVGIDEHPQELYVVMGKNNSGFYWYEVVSHVRKTLSGILRVCNQNYLMSENQIKIIKVDLKKCEVLFEGKHTK